MTRARLLLALGLALLAPGCIKFVEPAALSSATEVLEPGVYEKVGPQVRGEADAIIIFGIPVGDTSHTARVARDDALARAPGSDALINVSVSCNTTIYFLGIVTVTNTWVWGEPVWLAGQ